MTTALQRLLKYPHAAVFDKAPGADLALRVRHEDGAVWTVADGVMTVKAGALERSYSLADFTVGSLAAELAADGFQVPTIAQEWQPRSALVLVEGRGDQGESNGDHVQAFTSLLWVLLSGFAVEVREAEYQVGQALLQMVVTTAAGEWLDLWGTLYGVPRLQSEADDDFRLRISREAFRLRVNAHAIEMAILDATGDNVEIVEPWKLMFRLDESLLSGPHRIQDADYYNYHVIQAVGPSGANWNRIPSIVDRNRAAGVIQYRHRATVPGSVLVSNVWDGASLISARNTISGTKYIWDDRTLLDYSLIEDIPVLNHASRRRKTLRRTSFSRLSDRSWPGTPWADSTWGSLVAFIHSQHSRTYRVHYSLVLYQGMPWPNATWSGRWSDSTSVESSRSRILS